MNKKEEIKSTLITAMFLISLGGWLLHFRIHSPDKIATNYLPFISGIIGVFVLPFLFYSRKTLNLAYILTGFQAIFATILMLHYSIIEFQGPLTPVTLFLNTLLADIGVAWAKFAVGRAIYELEYFKSEADMVSRGRYFRYPNLGWWWVHLVGLSAIYAAGNILWK